MVFSQIQRESKVDVFSSLCCACDRCISALRNCWRRQDLRLTMVNPKIEVNHTSLAYQCSHLITRIAVIFLHLSAGEVFRCVNKDFCPGGPPGSCAAGRDAQAVACGSCSMAADVALMSKAKHFEPSDWWFYTIVLHCSIWDDDINMTMSDICSNGFKSQKKTLTFFATRFFLGSQAWKDWVCRATALARGVTVVTTAFSWWCCWWQYWALRFCMRSWSGTLGRSNQAPRWLWHWASSSCFDSPVGFETPWSPCFWGSCHFDQHPKPFLKLLVQRAAILKATKNMTVFRIPLGW